MAASDAVLSARFEGPEDLEKGRNNPITCPVERGGRIITPSAATVTIYNSAGTEVVSTASASATGGIMGYTVTSTVLADYLVGEGWSVEWAVTVDDVVHTFRRTCSLVRRRLYPVITERDLYRIQSSLQPGKGGQVGDSASWQPKIDEAWLQIRDELRSRGSLPHLIASPEDLRGVHLYTTLAMIYEDLASAKSSTVHAEIAAQYRARLGSMWSGLKLVWDQDQDGVTDDVGARKPVYRNRWLGSRFA